MHTTTVTEQQMRSELTAAGIALDSPGARAVLTGQMTFTAADGRVLDVDSPAPSGAVLRPTTPHHALTGIEAVAAALDALEAGADDDDHVFELPRGGCTADEVADALDAVERGEL